MVQIPTLVQEAPLVRLTNSVLVGLMRFTKDTFGATFDEETPAPAKMAQQLVSFGTAYDVLNRYYASARESLITKEISGLDEEGDQLWLGVKESTEASQRMTFDQARKAAADRHALAQKKYKVDVKENMTSEWSKIQQYCEEVQSDAQLTADAATLGLTTAIARLDEIAELITQKIAERSAQQIDHAAMKQAREAMYPEYRTLILLLNSYAATDEDPHRYDAIIRALNDKIDYIRQHAMSGGGDEGGDDDGGSDDEGGGDEPEPTGEKFKVVIFKYGNGTASVKDAKGNVINNNQLVTEGTTLNVSITPVAGKTPTASVNGANLPLTKSGTTYTASFQMPSKATSLQINTDPSDDGDDN